MWTFSVMVCICVYLAKTYKILNFCFNYSCLIHPFSVSVWRNLTWVSTCVPAYLLPIEKSEVTTPSHINYAHLIHRTVLIDMLYYLSVTYSYDLLYWRNIKQFIPIAWTTEPIVKVLSLIENYLCEMITC